MCATAARLIRPACTSLVVLALAGCLTRGLWNWTDPDRVPDLATSVTRCEVAQVLVPPDVDAAAPGTYAIALRPRAGTRPPRHLVEQARNGPAWLLVHPLAECPAAQAMEQFEPRGYELDVFDGAYLRRHTNNVRMTLLGTVPPAAIAQEVAAADLPSALGDAPIPLDRLFPWGPLHRALEGLGAQDWLGLTADTATLTPQGIAEPIAFVDASGAPMTLDEAAEVLTAPAGDPRAARAAHARLLARVRDLPTGTITYFAVPVPVLLNASDLTLVRSGETIAFAWARRGHGRFVKARAVPDDLVGLALPAARTDLDYEWSTERPTDEPFLNALQVLLTPFTAILDFLIESNPTLTALRDMLFPPPPPPVRPRRGN